MAETNKNGSRRGVFNFLLGSPLETSAVPHQVIGKIPALAVFSSDALSSVAYATQEMLAVLALAGSGYFGISIPLSLAIAGLLVILTVSYRQTIFAYPNGGGAYIVARDNLGEVIAQVAEAALTTDYILTVAVSISSGVAQITSAVPGFTSLQQRLHSIDRDGSHLERGDSFQRTALEKRSEHNAGDEHDPDDDVYRHHHPGAPGGGSAQ